MIQPSESTSISEAKFVDYFTLTEVRKAKSITKSTRERRGGMTVHEAIMELLRGEPLARINKVTDQENDLSYIAWRLEHIANIARFDDLKD